jgi:hypothetical protein
MAGIGCLTEHSRWTPVTAINRIIANIAPGKRSALHYSDLCW